jgi:gentisate 1,2-dioxygenase
MHALRRGGDRAVSPDRELSGSAAGKRDKLALRPARIARWERRRRRIAVTTTPITTRETFYQRLAEKNMAPLWEALKGLVPREPTPNAVPAVWHYDELRDLLMEAGRVVTAREAQRRVLVLENPGLQGSSRITQSLYAGLQVLMPGEIAPSHRHTQSALRFVLEGRGAYTAVDGERTTMQPGDFVITPAWAWHDHGNDGGAPMVWLDGLDIPLVNFLDAGFSEDDPRDTQPVERPEGDSLARYGTGLLPLAGRVSPRATGAAASGAEFSPVFNYPYQRARASLDQLARRKEWDPCAGLRLRYVNPLDGGWAMPTIGTFLQLLPKSFAGRPYRSTDAAVFALIEGRGRTRVRPRGGDTAAEQVLEWGPRDVFVVPAWAWHQHEADEESVLFSFSNRPVQEKLGLFREERQ